MEARLAPLGGVLDGLLARLAAVEKQMIITAEKEPLCASTETETTSEKNKNSAVDVDVEALHSEIAVLRDQLATSEKQRQRVERQLTAAGIKVAEDIPYEIAKSKIASIAQRMQEIGFANIQIDDDEDMQKKLREEYYVLELEMEKFNNALTTSDEHIQQMYEEEQKWESDISHDNRRALLHLRRHMPVEIKNYSEEQLTAEMTPNGKRLPRTIAKKFKRCNVLQLLRMDPAELRNLHPAILENFRVTGMTLTERRAVYCHLTESKPTATTDSATATPGSCSDGSESLSIAEMWDKNQKDPMIARKLRWYNMMRDNLKSSLSQYEAHVKECGQQQQQHHHHQCNLIGNQCPVRADTSVIDYFAEDYGYPDGDIYQNIEEVVTVSQSVNSEKAIIDPKQLSEDRVKKEIQNRKRLAYEEWKRTYDKEFEKFVENVSIRKVKVRELERLIEQWKQDEIEYTEEHHELKVRLATLPKSCAERLSLMKKINTSQTKCADTKRAIVLTLEELDKLNQKLQCEKEFVCSLPKPEWDENNEEGQNIIEVVFPRLSLSPSSSSSNNNGGIEHSSGRESRRSSVGGDDGGGGGGRGGLLAAIQAGRGGGRRTTKGVGEGNSGRGSLLVAMQSGGKSKQLSHERDKPVTMGGFQMRVPNEAFKKESSKVPQCRDDSAKIVPSSLSEKTGDDTAVPIAVPNGISDGSSLEANKTRNFFRKSSSSGTTRSNYKRLTSGGSGVMKTALVDCPPPKENILHSMKAHLEESMKREQMLNVAKERLRQEKEARLLDEAREKEEDEKREFERLALIANLKEEEERNRSLAKETEKERLCGDEEEKAAETDRINTDKIITQLGERVQKAREAAVEYEEKMKKSKQELKEMPRGSKDRVAKMKEINMYQQKTGEAKKATEAAAAELRSFLNPGAILFKGHNGIAGTNEG